MFNDFIEEIDIPDVPSAGNKSQTNLEASVVSESNNVEKGEPFIDSNNHGDTPIFVIDKFIETTDIENTKNIILNSIPLYIAYCPDNVTFGKWEPLSDLVRRNNWNLTHMFLSNGQWVSDHKNIIEDLYNTINPIAKLDAYASVNLSTENNLLLGGYYSNYPRPDIPIYTCCICLDTTNGYTSFKDGYNVRDVAGRLIIFPSHLSRGIVSCTDIQHNCRMTFNFIHTPDFISGVRNIATNNKSE